MLSASAKTLAKLIYDRRLELKYAVGSGVSTWDNFNPPVFPDRSTLHAETMRVDITSIEYVDPTTYASTGGALSNALKIVGLVPATSTIDNTYIREKAIFLGNGTNSKDTGNLIHAETTALETKVAGKEFESIIYLIIR